MADANGVVALCSPPGRRSSPRQRTASGTKASRRMRQQEHTRLPDPNLQQSRTVIERIVRWMLAAVIVWTAIYVFRPVASPRHPLDSSPSRLDATRRAQVYLPTNVRAKDLRRGPQGP